MPSSATMEGTISSERRVRPKANFAASNNRFEKAEGYLGKWNLFC